MTRSDRTPLLRRWLPAGLARRFALAAAGLAAGAVLVISLFSWWLITRQQEEALHRLTTHEAEFHAKAVGSDLNALALRMAEVAQNTILATGLVDSAGRETYLRPFLEGIRQINGIPIHLLFTDFEGKEISSNGSPSFSKQELAWLSEQLQAGRPNATIFSDANGPSLVAVQPLVYARTTSPEGGLFYKMRLADLHLAPHMRLVWGETQNGPQTVPVPSPEIFQPLRFRVANTAQSPEAESLLAPPFLPIVLVGLLLFIGVALAGMRLARILTRDLRELESFSSRFLHSESNTSRAPVGGSAEVASLARSVNAMLDRLEAQHMALLQEQEKLTKLAEALQAADRRKDEFLATLAHELRNPLAPIKNSVAILKAQPLHNPHLTKVRDIISRQVDHMSRLLDDLLDVSRITRNKLELRPQLIPLAEVVQTAVETSRPLIDAAGHTLDIDLPPQPVLLYVDPVRMAQVLANLLNNAAKYTPRGGRIAVTADLEGAQVVIAVKDNGIGIREEQLPRIFEMFAQSGALQQGEGGLGIGLSLVRGLVQMHGGTVQAHSEGPGKGSVFEVRLNVAETPAAANEAPVRKPASQGPLRIAVVDDNRDAADSLAAVLSMWGHDVRKSYDGAAAIETAAAFKPHVVMLDIGMPKMDGYEAARRIRSEPWGKQMVLVALTGWGQEADKLRAREAGFDHHIVKPADPEQLEDVLGRLSSRAA